jgi:2-hydroxy-3-oxopropionate reductase
MSQNVAFIGLGVMGGAMAANLLKAGFTLSVHTRSKGKAEALIEAGARWAATGAEAATGAAVIGLCLPDSPDVEAALFGPAGVAETAAQGSVVIDFSTIAPAAARDFAARLAAKGVALLDSPVSGGPGGAIAGTLTCMVGGDAAALAKAESFFKAVGKTVTHLGPSGSGQVCKAANQMIITAAMQATAEAMALGAKSGLDTEAMRTALLGGAARSFVLESHTKRMLDQAFSPAGFRAELMLKDMKIALAAAREAGVYAPAAGLALAAMQAVVNSGRGGDDAATLGQVVAELSGLPKLRNA